MVGTSGYVAELRPAQGRPPRLGDAAELLVPIQRKGSAALGSLRVARSIEWNCKRAQWFG